MDQPWWRRKAEQKRTGIDDGSEIIVSSLEGPEFQALNLSSSENDVSAKADTKALRSNEESHSLIAQLSTR